MLEIKKSKDELSENSRNIRENVEMHRFKKKKKLFCVYKMVEINNELWGKNGVEVRLFNSKKWLNETNIKD